MPRPDQTPKLPKIPFLVGDAALLGVAWYVADHAHQPLAFNQTLAIVACVVVASIIGVIPFLTEYARRQDEALDERQRELEALARTVSASAEQISIAAQGLQEITALAEKNLKAAEDLPRQLQDQVARLQRPEAGRGAEKQKAEKEISVALAAKTERLEAVAEQIAKGAADWAKAEHAFQKMVAAFAPSPAGPAPEQQGEVPAPRPEEPAPPAALPALEEKPAEAPKWESDPEPLPVALPAEPMLEVVAPLTPALEMASAPVSPKPPRKPRKPKVAAEPAAPPPAEPSPLESVPAETLVSDPIVPEHYAAEPKPAAEPAGVEAILAELREPDPEPEPAAETPAPAAVSEFSQVSPEEAAPAPAVSSDGATRLIVTAYIGIGNRLFIRGAGPGLSWEKGVPLQFVSIGKWRWETAEASGPIRFKLYKNDEIECVALGESTLEAGRQQDLSAGF